MGGCSPLIVKIPEFSRRWPGASGDVSSESTVLRSSSRRRWHCSSQRRQSSRHTRRWGSPPPCAWHSAADAAHARAVLTKRRRRKSLWMFAFSSAPRARLQAAAHSRLRRAQSGHSKPPGVTAFSAQTVQANCSRRSFWPHALIRLEGCILLDDLEGFHRVAGARTLSKRHAAVVQDAQPPCLESSGIGLIDSRG